MEIKHVIPVFINVAKKLACYNFTTFIRFHWIYLPVVQKCNLAFSCKNELFKHRRMDVTSLVPAGLQPAQSKGNEIPPGYNIVSENFRKYTPSCVQCAIFCGGSKCKYENHKAWPSVHMAIPHIFSHWWVSKNTQQRTFQTNATIKSKQLWEREKIDSG